MLNRRDVLKNAAFGSSSLVLAPLVQQIRAQADAKTVASKRFVFVVEGNGLNWEQIVPVGTTRAKEGDQTKLVQESLTGKTLPKSLEPIKAYQDRINVVLGLSGRVAGGGHSNDFGALGVYNCGGGVGNSGAPKAETIDVALAKKVGGIFPHVGLGMVDRPDANVVYNCSAWDANKPMPTQCNPELAFGQLFGSIAGGSAKQEFLAEGNMLDFLRDDLKTLQAQVAGPEKEKLAQHLAAYEDMRNRQSRLNEIESTLRKHAPVVNNKYKSAVETDRLDAQFDIATAALIGGLTNCVTLASGVGNPFFSVKFTGLGINFGKHGIGHGGSFNGMTWDVMATTIRRFHFELIARMMKKLEEVKEGDGTMLDNTVIIYLSDAAEKHHSRCFEWPVVVIGNMGGKMKTGNYIQYPYWGNKGHRELGNFYTTLLHLAGDKRDFFNMKDPMLKHLDQNGPLVELLA